MQMCYVNTYIAELVTARMCLCWSIISSAVKKVVFLLCQLRAKSIRYRVTQKNGNFWKTQNCKTFLWRKHAVDRSTDPWLLNGEVVCSSRSLFRGAANCTWLPLRISKVPVFLCHPVLWFWTALIYLLSFVVHPSCWIPKVWTLFSQVKVSTKLCEHLMCVVYSVSLCTYSDLAALLLKNSYNSRLVNYSCCTE